MYKYFQGTRIFSCLFDSLQRRIVKGSKSKRNLAQMTTYSAIYGVTLTAGSSKKMSLGSRFHKFCLSKYHLCLTKSDKHFFLGLI